MEKEQAMDYEELTVYQTLVVKAGIKAVRVKSKVTGDMKMAGTFKRTSLVKAMTQYNSYD